MATTLTDLAKELRATPTLATAERVAERLEEIERAFLLDNSEYGVALRLARAIEGKEP